MGQPNHDANPPPGSPGPASDGARPPASPPANPGNTDISAGVLSPPVSAKPSEKPNVDASTAWSSTPEPSSRPQPGSEFGSRYYIQSLLGEGGMGAVYKAYDKELDRFVALKLVRSDLLADPGLTRRFKQELLLASRISHKNVLRIHDLGEVGGVKFISMAYVEGEDLGRILHEQGRLSLERTLGIARQICAGLAAAHAEGVVHRDLKPQNVLIDHAGNACISDFGLAKSRESGAIGSMTVTGQMLGTPRYVSPEQVQGKPADQRSDIYALGLILYEMVTGDVPFSGDTTYAVMYQRVNRDAPDPNLRSPDLPPYLSRIILRCLERDPEDRYQSAQEILDDLNAERASVGRRRLARAFHRRRAQVVVAAVLLFAVAITGFLIRGRIVRPSPRTGAENVAITGAPPLAKGMYVAVLPFRPSGDDQSLRYVAAGISEALSTKLFQLRGLHVTSQDEVAKLRGDEPLESIARDLGINVIVQGALRQAGDKIVTSVDVRDLAGGRRLWAGEVSGDAQDLLTIEDQLYKALITALDLKPGSAELAQASAHPTENLAAYDFYLKGREALRTEHDAKAAGTAISFYEDALKADPNFALAYAGLADASLNMYDNLKDRSWADKALFMAQKATELNDKLPEAHFLLGSAYDLAGKSAQAIEEIKRALALEPDSDDAYRRLGRAYLAAGRKNEGVQALEKAVQIDPYYWVNYNALGGAYFQLADWARALKAFRQVTVLQPDIATGYQNIGAVELQTGEYENAISAFQKALAIAPRYEIYSNLGTAYYYLKRYTDAIPMYEKAVQLNPGEQVVIGNLGDAYRFSGQREKANATYERAIVAAYKELEVNPRQPDVLADLGLYYARKGDGAQGLEFIRRALALDKTSAQFLYDKVMIQVLANQPEEAVKTLREAFKRGFPAAMAKNDPELNPLRNRPDFQRALDQYTATKN